MLSENYHGNLIHGTHSYCIIVPITTTCNMHPHPRTLTIQQGRTQLTALNDARHDVATISVGNDSATIVISCLECVIDLAHLAFAEDILDGHIKDNGGLCHRTPHNSCARHPRSIPSLLVSSPSSSPTSQFRASPLSPRSTSGLAPCRFELLRRGSVMRPCVTRLPRLLTRLNLLPRRERCTSCLTA